VKIAEKVADRYRVFGISGVLVTIAHHVTGHPRYIRVKYHGDVRMRFGTSDQCVYKEVVLDEDYKFDLGFTPQVIVDGGANIGLSSIYYANRYPSAKIIAVEPEVSNFAMLERNVRPYKQITPIHAALWNHEGFIHLSDPLGEPGAWNKWGTTTSENGTGERVRAVSVRSLIDQFRLSKIDLLKVDIEGSEIELFSTYDWLSLVNALVVETHDRFRPGCSSTVDAATREFQKTFAGSAGNLVFYTRHASLHST
jgi:FkbM family methyltransferase